ncbi:helix-turn-helix domain-containing protein [Streptomyces sp. S1A]|uniref:helix-turn-helix transcriptional regulator n=1 Tax=Streptomyces sp. ICN903 TaxID=2964654 RepID=UPI001EDA7674|nr:helix-turn-helix domain-containing protein [Streptomyces sp. ICN903]MCG3039282.1 helix-turn-helix domain-containing protein [Streptomyces sp. ICN903]
MQLEAGTYIGTREAAAILGVSPALLRLWRSEGRGPESVKLGGTVVYREEMVKAYAKRRHD